MTVKLKNRLAVLLCVTISMILFSACSGKDVSGRQSADAEAETAVSGTQMPGGGMELPEGYAWVAGFEDAGRENPDMSDPYHLIDGSFYYRVHVFDRDRRVRTNDLYIQERGEKARLLLHFEREEDEQPEESENWLECFTVGEDGSLYLLYSVRKSADEAEAYILKKLDRELREIYSLDTTAGMAEALSIQEGLDRLYEMQVDADGAIYGMTSNGTVILWNEKGEYQESFSLNVRETGGARGLIHAGSAGIYAYFMRSDEEGQRVQIYDVEAWREMGEAGRSTAEPLLVDLRSAPKPVVSEAGTFDQLYLFGGREGGIYLADKNRLWQVDRTDGSLTGLFTWDEVALKAGYIRELLQREDGSFLIYITDTLEKENYWVELNPTPVSQIPEKTELVLGIAGRYYSHSSLTTSMEQVVMSYNRTHPECHVRIVEYEESKESLTRFQMELLNGEGPDILLERRSFFDMENLMQKGAVEDLAPYLAETTTGEEILPGIRNQITKNGKIPRIPLGFSAGIMIVPADTPQRVMTPEEMLAFMTQDEQGYADCLVWPMGLLLSILSGAEMDRYVDEENGSCSFDSKEFVAFLEALAVLDDRERIKEREERAERFQAGELSVIVEELNCLADYFYFRDTFSGTARIVGFPNSRGELRYPANLYDWMGINSASKYKKEAWSFIEFCLSYTSRCDEVNDRFAVTKDMFERQTSHEETTDRGIKTRNDYGRNFLGEKIAATTQEETDFLRGIADHLYFYENSDLMQIIEEEAAAFFAGDIRAEEAAKRIHNRAMLVLGE